jgi:hypothetical protein
VTAAGVPSTGDLHRKIDWQPGCRLGAARLPALCPATVNRGRITFGFRKQLSSTPNGIVETNAVVGSNLGDRDERPEVPPYSRNYICVDRDDRKLLRGHRNCQRDAPWSCNEAASASAAGEQSEKSI